MLGGPGAMGGKYSLHVEGPRKGHRFDVWGTGPTLSTDARHRCFPNTRKGQGAETGEDWVGPIPGTRMRPHLLNTAARRTGTRSVGVGRGV